MSLSKKKKLLIKFREIFFVFLKKKILTNEKS